MMKCCLTQVYDQLSLISRQHLLEKCKMLMLLLMLKVHLDPGIFRNTSVALLREGFKKKKREFSLSSEGPPL